MTPFTFWARSCRSTRSNFSIALSQNTIKAGDIFKAILVPDILVPASAGLTSIQGIFEYPRNHFATGANTIQGNGVNVVTPNGPTVVGNMEQYSFTVNSVTPISLVAGSSIVSLPIEADDFRHGRRCDRYNCISVRWK